MRRSVIALAFVLFVGPSAAHADVITFDFVQTSASQPGLTFDASITIDGTFADLPTINCHHGFSLLPPPGCTDALSPVLDFSITVTKPTGLLFTINDEDLFVPPAQCFTGSFCPAFLYPSWSLSATAFMYLDVFETWAISFEEFAAVAFGSDNLAVQCAGAFFSTNCTGAGFWQASTPDTGGAPEPPMIFLFAAALTALAWRRVYERRLRPLPVRANGRAR